MILNDIKYNEMSNTDLKILMETLNNEFEGKKNELKRICEEMENIEKKYLKAKQEIEIRKNLYI